MTKEQPFLGTEERDFSDEDLELKNYVENYIKVSYITNTYIIIF